VANSLHGNWDEALLLALKVAFQSYQFYQSKIQDCDRCIEQHLSQFESRCQLSTPAQSLKAQLQRVCGVDLTTIPGIKEQLAQIIFSEVGLDMSPWKTEKQFCSFLGLCPNNSISGGKVLRRSTRKVYNRPGLRCLPERAVLLHVDSGWTLKCPFASQIQVLNNHRCRLPVRANGKNNSSPADCVFAFCLVSE
jgi:transposase